MNRRSWIAISSLTGAVACPALVAIAAVLVHDLRGPVFDVQGMPALLVSGAGGIFIGWFVASRAASTTPRRKAILGAVCGSILGAAAMGSLFLAIEVASGDWPHGLSAFVMGSIGAVVGGLLGCVIGSMQVDPRTVDQGHAVRRGRSASAGTSLRDVR